MNETSFQFSGKARSTLSHGRF